MLTEKTGKCSRESKSSPDPNARVCFLPLMPPPQTQLLWERLPGMLARSGFLELLFWQPLPVHKSRGSGRADTSPRLMCMGTWTVQPRLNRGF